MRLLAKQKKQNFAAFSNLIEAELMEDGAIAQNEGGKKETVAAQENNLSSEESEEDGSEDDVEIWPKGAPDKGVIFGTPARVVVEAGCGYCAIQNCNKPSLNHDKHCSRNNCSQMVHHLCSIEAGFQIGEGLMCFCSRDCRDEYLKANKRQLTNRS